MSAGAQLSVTDLRRMARHPVDHPVIAEHYRDGDVRMHIANISANGFMIDDARQNERGDRVIVRLPVIGRISTSCWVMTSVSRISCRIIFKGTEAHSPRAL